MNKKQSFEEALVRLEEIVKVLESGETDLDDMIKSYEEGAELIKLCLAKLEGAEKKIMELGKKGADQFELTPVTDK